MARAAVSLVDPARTAGAITRGSDTTLAEQLAQRYAERIRQRLLAPGARLPSVRDCARHHAVSPHTVVAAYDQLQALGLVEARRQRGFFVRPGPDAAARDSTAAPARPLAGRPMPNSATALIRGMFQAPGERPMPGLGTLPADWLDAALLATAMRRATSARQTEATALQYGDPAGELRLRRALAAKLADHGVAASPAQIVTTIGATHALDIVTRTCCAPATACSSTSPAGRSSTPASPRSGCTYCRCRAARAGPTSPPCAG